MNNIDLKLFAIIYQWSNFYKRDGREYTPSNKKLASDLGVDYHTVADSLDKLKEFKLISITLNEDGFRTIASAI